MNASTSLDLVHWPGEFWYRGSQLIGDFAPLQPGCSGVVLRKGGGDEAETRRRPLLPAWSSALRMKWTRQRCQLAVSTFDYRP
jgi:hypothetical protein